MLSTAGESKVALFGGSPPGEKAESGFYRVAFRVSGAAFLQFLDRLEERPVFDRDGRRITRSDAVDRDPAFSVYFVGPHGHGFEVTTYDREPVADALD